MSKLSELLEWALMTLEDKLTFGMDEAQAVYRREARVIGVLVDAVKEVKELEEKIAQSQAVYNSLIDGAARDTLRINELQAENLRLSTIVTNQKTVIEINQADNAKLRECVEFYADQNSYKCLIEDHHVTVFVVNSDTEPPFNSSVRMVGGKRARSCLKELETSMEEA